MSGQPEGPLSGKVILVFGLSNDRGIAWGITKALAAQGARFGFSYPNQPIEKRMRPLAEQVGAELIQSCDVQVDEDIETFFSAVKERFGRVDILVHAVAYAPIEAMENPFLETTREQFKIAHDVSAYSLIALARAAASLMPEGGSILTMTYYGSEKVVPTYNVMGVAKASLEATVRYLAVNLGGQGIRVNAISSGPIRTLAAQGIPGFVRFQKAAREIAPLKGDTTIEDIGQTAAFLCSEGARFITGEVLYVDGGFNIVGVSQPQS